MDSACAIVPRFAVAFARREDPGLEEQPVVVARSSEMRGTVMACSEEAARTGIEPGMLVTRALALCPTAAVTILREEHVEQAGRAFRNAVAELCPAVEEIEPGHVHADIRGLAKLRGLPAEEYLAEFQDALAQRSGLPVHVGGAASVFAAHVAAEYLAKPSRVLSPEAAREQLGALPVEALPVSAAMLRRLHLFGIKRLDQLGEMPPAALQAQFGREGLLAWRLIHGEEHGRITPGREEQAVVERLALPAPAVLGTPLILATEILLQRGVRRPEVDGRALRRADLVVELENEERVEKRSVFHEPTSDTARMLFVLRQHIERLELPAPAIAVELALSGICSEYARQERLWQTGPRGQAALGAAVDQLAARTGAPQVYRVVEVEPWSRIPERQRALAAYSP